MTAAAPLRVLVTGSSGFVGGYLANYLAAEGAQVWGGVFSGEEGSGDASARLRPVTLDVSDREQVLNVVRDVSPDEIYHLAAISRPASDDRQAFYRVNLQGTLNILNAAAEKGAAVLVVGSAYVYGDQEGLLDETCELRPVNDYGVSKAAADLAGFSAALQGGRVVRVRPFNHVGPGQSPSFVLPTLIRQVAHIEEGLQPPVVKLGNLDSVRDFCDVRDVIEAYPRLLREAVNGEVYNLASGIGTSIRMLVNMLQGMADADIEVQIEAARVRATDIRSLVGDAARARATIGWTARRPLRETLTDMLAYERERVGRTPPATA